MLNVVAGAMDAAVMVAEAMHRQQLHTIKAAALVNLAYLQLQQQQWQQAVAYSQQLLQVTEPVTVLTARHSVTLQSSLLDCNGPECCVDVETLPLLCSSYISAYTTLATYL